MYKVEPIKHNMQWNQWIIHLWAILFLIPCFLWGSPSTHMMVKESALGLCIWLSVATEQQLWHCFLPVCFFLPFLKSHFMSYRKQWTSGCPLNSPASSHDKLLSPPSNSPCVGGRSMMMSLLAALEQASCVELACYQTVQYIFGTARWRTSWSIIDLFHYSVLTTLPGARGVFPPL